MATATAERSHLDIAYHFDSVPDPRHPAFRNHHLLSDILVIAFCAVLTGARSWQAIAQFGVSKVAWLLRIGLKLPNGIPSHDTFDRVFSDLDPAAFQDSFSSWINGVCASLGVRHIPIDGQTLRGTRGLDGTCLHLVSAWAAEHRLTLAQVAVEGKSNEITAIPELLKLLDLKGALVSIDAMGCQKKIAADIREGEGDYLLTVKDNQPTLHADVVACFLQAYDTDFAGLKYDRLVTQDVGHGRQEERCYTVIYEPEGLTTGKEWVDLKAVVQVIRTRRVQDKETVEVSYHISSSEAAVTVLAEGIRGHWGIENGQHWSLDVLYGQDRCRTRHKNGAENLAWVRKMALALLRHDGTKGTVPTKQFRAALDDDYRAHLLDILSQ